MILPANHTRILIACVIIVIILLSNAVFAAGTPTVANWLWFFSSPFIAAITIILLKRSEQHM